MRLVKPRALRPGDGIGIVSTSSPVSAADLDRLTGYLRGRGYQVTVAPGVLDCCGYLAGAAEQQPLGPEQRAAGRRGPAERARGERIPVPGWPDADEPTESAFWQMVTGPVAGREITGPGWRAYRAGR